MKTAQHTPGPWKVIDKSGYYQTIRTDNHVIADVRMIGGYPYNSGDAALIAAAPELLEACLQLIDLFDNRDAVLTFPGVSENDNVLCNIRKAIAKAKGGV